MSPPPGLGDAPLHISPPAMSSLNRPAPPAGPQPCPEGGLYLLVFFRVRHTAYGTHNHSVHSDGAFIGSDSLSDP